MSAGLPCSSFHASFPAPWQILIDFVVADLKFDTWSLQPAIAKMSCLLSLACSASSSSSSSTCAIERSHQQPGSHCRHTENPDWATTTRMFVSGYLQSNWWVHATLTINGNGREQHVHSRSILYTWIINWTVMLMYIHLPQENGAPWTRVRHIQDDQPVEPLHEVYRLWVVFLESRYPRNLGWSTKIDEIGKLLRCPDSLCQHKIPR